MWSLPATAPIDLAQPPLDAGVDVFIGDGEREITVVDLGEDLPESALDRRASSAAMIPCLPSMRAWAIDRGCPPVPGARRTRPRR